MQKCNILNKKILGYCLFAFSYVRKKKPLKTVTLPNRVVRLPILLIMILLGVRPTSTVDLFNIAEFQLVLFKMKINK